MKSLLIDYLNSTAHTHLSNLHTPIQIGDLAHKSFDV